MMYRNLDDCPFIRCSLTIRPSATQPVSKAPDTPIGTPTPSRALHRLFEPGSWSYAVARLLQRAQETQCLLHEDLREVLEPLDKLAQAARSPEQQAQQQAAQHAYQQATQVITQALAPLFEQFPAEVTLLQQTGCFTEDTAMCPPAPQSSPSPKEVAREREDEDRKIGSLR
jgi:hypothetical protein